MRNVLICEDDPVQLKVLLAAFCRAGYDTFAARSPGQALRQLENKHPDVIVSDVRLEEGDAFELLQGAQRIGLDAPMVMISAFSSDSLRARAVRAGAAGFFEKTGNHRELIERVGRVVRERQGRRLGARVLIADGDRLAGESLAAALEAAGFDTIRAEDGPQATQLARAARPAVDFAVVDLRTPGLGGAALVEAVRTAAPGLYVALVGDKATTRADLRAAYAAGGQTFFRAPVVETDLARHLEASLGRARDMRRAATRQAERPTRSRGLSFRFLRSAAGRAVLLLGLAFGAGIGLGAVWQGVLTEAAEESRRVERAFELMEQRESQYRRHAAPSSPWAAQTSSFPR